MIWETKTVRIESADIPWDGTQSTLEIIADFIGSEELYLHDTRSAIQLKVWNILENQWLNVPVGHWVVKGLKGEFYPCDPGAMDMKYKEVYDELTIDALINGIKGLPDAYDDPRIDNACGVLRSILETAVRNDAVSLTRIKDIVAKSTDFPDFWDEDKEW